jgi:hypothetical protein
VVDQPLGGFRRAIGRLHIVGREVTPLFFSPIGSDQDDISRPDLWGMSF